MADQKVLQIGSLLVIKTVSLLASQKVSQTEMPLVITTLLCLVDQKVLPMGIL